uniref:Uncharacterized protein n=1 Tax=Lygus hesperus TaxID=30085 RepID=A0A0K8SGI7_LYGHE
MFKLSLQAIGNIKNEAQILQLVKRINARQLATAAQRKPEKAKDTAPKESRSFMYSDVLTAEQKDTLNMLIDPVTKFFGVATNVLNNGRFGMSAALSGTMRAVTKKATEHATTRVQFGRKIDTYGTIQEKLARMAMLHYVTESIAYCLSGNMDSGSVDYHLGAAIFKEFASESAWCVADEAIIQILGMGFIRLFVALTRTQFAGSHLRELQKAFKQPTAHLSLILEEVTKRGLRTVGLGGTPNLSNHVHPSLTPSAALAAKSVAQFGPAVEALLVKYGRGIIEQQFLLNRVASSAIDIYTMVVALSRATRSLQAGTPSAQHEALMVKVWCSEASARVSMNLGALSNSESLDNFSTLSQIAKNVCEAGGFVQPNPLGI